MISFVALLFKLIRWFEQVILITQNFLNYTGTQKWLAILGLFFNVSFLCSFTVKIGGSKI